TYFHLSIGTATKGDQAQAVAQDLHRNGKFVVIDERGFRREGGDAHDLADHSTFINHGHTWLYAAGTSFVDNQVVIEGTGGLEQHFNRDGRLSDRTRHIQETP